MLPHESPEKPPPLEPGQGAPRQASLRSAGAHELRALRLGVACVASQPSGVAMELRRTMREGKAISGGHHPTPTYTHTRALALPVEGARAFFLPT